MDIILRDVSPYVLKVIDQEAKDKKVSRNEFLKEYLEKEFMPDSQKKQFREIQVALDRNTIAIEKFLKALDEINLLSAGSERDRERSNIHSVPAITSMRSKLIEKKKEDKNDSIDEMKAFYELAKEVENK